MLHDSGRKSCCSRLGQALFTEKRPAHFRRLRTVGTALQIVVHNLTELIALLTQGPANTYIVDNISETVGELLESYAPLITTAAKVLAFLPFMWNVPSSLSNIVRILKHQKLGQEPIKKRALLLEELIKLVNAIAISTSIFFSGRSFGQNATLNAAISQSPADVAALTEQAESLPYRGTTCGAYWDDQPTSTSASTAANCVNYATALALATSRSTAALGKALVTGSTYVTLKVFQCMLGRCCLKSRKRTRAPLLRGDGTTPPPSVQPSLPTV